VGNGTTIIKDCDVLVVGGGISAGFAALRAKDAGAKTVIQVDKGAVGKSGMSAFAAGVLLDVLHSEDNIDNRVHDAVRYSKFLYQQDRVKDHFEQVTDLIQELDRWGAGFVKESDAKLKKVAGRGQWPQYEFPGNKLMDSLRKEAKKRGIEHINKTMVTDLLKKDGHVIGTVGFNTESGDFYVFRAKATVMATGSTWYKGLSPGHRPMTGDGYVACFRAGAVVRNAESNEAQGHAFCARYDIGPGMNRYVGEGGVFFNAKGEAFMEKYHPVLKDRAGLDVLSQAFAMEARQGNTPIFLDMTHFTTEQVRHLWQSLPLPMRQWERIGLVQNDRFIKPIEWMRTTPWARAGIRVNNKFESDLPGLFVVGETAGMENFSSGLTAAATSGETGGKHAAEYAKGVDITEVDNEQLDELRHFVFAPMERKDGIEPDHVLLSVQEAITPYDVWSIQHEKRLKKALEEIEYTKEYDMPKLLAYDPHYLRMAHEAANLVWVAEVSLRSAIFRKESRKAIREDYPYTDNGNWLKWTEARNAGNGKMDITATDVPIDTYPFKPDKVGKSLHIMWQLAEKAGIVKIEKGEVEWV